MNTSFFIEAFGYLGSTLVLVSMLMTSVVKLRIINTIGSIIFTIYAFIIHSYPTAFMNLALVLINLHFLWKMNRTDKVYEIIETGKDDPLLQYLLEHYHNDIENIFPGISLEFAQEERCLVVIHDGKPVGFTMCHPEKDALVLDLDYTIEQYRDFSIGSLLLKKYREEGIHKLVYRGPAKNHQKYLQNLGFVYENGSYICKL